MACGLDLACKEVQSDTGDFIWPPITPVAFTPLLTLLLLSLQRQVGIRGEGKCRRLAAPRGKDFWPVIGAGSQRAARTTGSHLAFLPLYVMVLFLMLLH